jgi:hypothetical protein
MPAQDSTFWISERKQLAALASPLRQEIVDTLAATGPSTIARLAGELGLRPDRLYFHVRMLQRVGLLVTRGTVGEGRAAAAVYDVPGSPVRIRRECLDIARSRAIQRIHEGVVRLARRDLKRAARAPGVSQEGPARTLSAGRFLGWLSPEQLAELNALSDRVAALMREARPRPGAQPISYMFVMTPVVGRVAPGEKGHAPSRRCSSRKLSISRTQPE